METHGFWHLWYQYNYGYVDTYIKDNSYGVHQINLLDGALGIDLTDVLTKFRPQMGTGTMVWIMLASLALCLSGKGKQKRLLLFFAPGFFCWVFIMIATPVAYSLRYVYILAMALPAYIWFPFRHKQDS